MEWGLVRDLVAIGAPVFGAGGVAYMVWRLNTDMVDIKADLKQLNKLATAMAVQDERMKSFDDRLNDFGRRLGRLEDRGSN